jgi:hypothetical protein
MTRVGQKLNALEPLGLGEVDLFDERVKMPDEGKHDSPEPWLGRALCPVKDLGRDVVFSRHGASGSFERRFHIRQQPLVTSHQPPATSH